MDQTNETRLGSAPLGKLLFQLGLPGVAAQVINVLYNIVDRIYIGNIPGIGDMALTGVGVTLPVIMVIAAFSAFVGMGGAPLASIRLGARDHEGAERILGSCIGFAALPLCHPNGCFFRLSATASVCLWRK